MQSLDPDLEAELGRIKDTAPRYGMWTKCKVHVHVHACIYSTSLVHRPRPQILDKCLY